MSIKVLIADDQEIIRAGLSTIIDGQPDMEVIGQADNGRTAVSLGMQLRPDVCLFDIRMPELDGVEATRQLAGPEVSEPLAVVIITTFDTDEYVYGALRAGARGFLLKDAGPELLLQAIKSAAAGDALIAPTITGRLLQEFAEQFNSSSSGAKSSAASNLTSREEDVVSQVAAGLTNPEIAESLHISLSTVKFHLAGLMDKLGVRNRVEIAIWAYETGRMRP